MGVFMGRGGELAGVNGRHHDIIAIFGPDKMSVGREIWPVGLIFSGGTKGDDSNRPQAFGGQAAFLKIERAKLFEPD
ncbi:MAG: hypothetical protein ABSE86_16205 [Bryobacteraceae bacterium]